MTRLIVFHNTEFKLEGKQSKVHVPVLPTASDRGGVLEMSKTTNISK